MFYVIVGILILIISFIVALLSLVWEQKKVEERIDDVDEAGAPSSVEPVDGSVDSYESVVEPVTDAVVPLGVVSGYDAMSDIGAGGALSGADEEVWWNKISSRGSTEDTKPGDSDDAKSINAIREELAKITANKIGLRPSELAEPEVVDVETSRMDAKKRNLLVGEFSLSDIRKKD